MVDRRRPTACASASRASRLVPRLGEANDDVTWPTMRAVDADRRALDRAPARPSSARTGGGGRASAAVRASAVRPTKSGLSIFTAQSMSEPPRRGVELGVHARRSRGPSRAAARTAPAARVGDAEVAAGVHQRRHSSTEWCTGWCSSKLASPVNDSRITWHGTPATSVWTCCRNCGGSCQPDAAQQLARQRAGDVDRAERDGAVEHVHVETPRLDPVAHPRLGERGAARGERQHEPVAAIVGRLRDTPCRRRSGDRAR